MAPSKRTAEQDEMKHKSWQLVVLMSSGGTMTTYAGAKTELQARKKVVRDMGCVVLSCLSLGEE